MTIILPSPAKNLLDIFEIILYYPNQIEDVNKLNIMYKLNKEVFLLFLEDLVENTLEEWEFAKTTLPFNQEFIQQSLKYIEILKERTEKVKEEIQKTEIESMEPSELEKISKKVLENIFSLFETYNGIQKVLSNQKQISAFPVLDRFLKLFWTYIENIKNLENFPINLLIKYLFSSVNFVENFHKQLEDEEKIVEFLSNKEKIKKIIENQKNYLEAIKYALGAGYSLINGEIDLTTEPDLPTKIFVQINQASNMLFVLQQEKKINPIELIKSIESIEEEGFKFLQNTLRNIINSALFNPLFIINVSQEYLQHIELIIEFLKNIDNLAKQEFIEKKELIINFFEFLKATLENEKSLKLENLTKIEKEILNTFLLFINNYLPIGTFINIFLNLKNTFLLFSLLNINKISKIENLINAIDDFVFYSVGYTLYKEYLEVLYINFVDFFNNFRTLNKEIESLLNSKIVCPSCKQENEFFSTKCSNCNFVFPVSLEKLVILNFQHSPVLIQSYILQFLDSYFIKKDIDNTLNQLNYTIEELEKLEKTANNSDNPALQNIKNFKNYLIQLKQKVQENNPEELIIEDILKILEHSKFIKTLMESPQV